MDDTFDKIEEARWKIIINVNPVEREPKKAKEYNYYAELSKVDRLGRIYGTKYYMYYKSPQEALEKMLEFAKENGIKVG